MTVRRYGSHAVCRPTAKSWARTSWPETTATQLLTIGSRRRLKSSQLENGQRFSGARAQTTSIPTKTMLEIERLDVAVEMIQRIRETVDGVRMDEYLRFEVRVGRPFFLLEPS